VKHRLICWRQAVGRALLALGVALMGGEWRIHDGPSEPPNVTDLRRLLQRAVDNDPHWRDDAMNAVGRTTRIGAK
jgi:hypothetical protein